MFPKVKFCIIKASQLLNVASSGWYVFLSWLDDLIESYLNKFNTFDDEEVEDSFRPQFLYVDMKYTLFEWACVEWPKTLPTIVVTKMIDYLIAKRFV